MILKLQFSVFTQKTIQFIILISKLDSNQWFFDLVRNGHFLHIDFQFFKHINHQLVQILHYMFYRCLHLYILNNFKHYKLGRLLIPDIYYFHLIHIPLHIINIINYYLEYIINKNLLNNLKFFHNYLNYLIHIHLNKFYKSNYCHHHICHNYLLNKVMVLTHIFYYHLISILLYKLCSHFQIQLHILYNLEIYILPHPRIQVFYRRFSMDPIICLELSFYSTI